MVSASVASLPVVNDENVSLTSSNRIGRNHNTHTRRQRFRLQNTGNPGQSRWYATRDAARRVSHTAPVVAPSRAFDFSAMMDSINLNEERTKSSTSLPRQLRRPAFRKVNPAAISAIEPDLSKVSVDFIQQKIHDIGEEMYYMVQQTSAKCPKGRLPREIDVVVNDISGSPPTHAFAVYTPPTALQKQHVSLYPVHALVLAATCANLPPLPYSKPAIPEYRGSTIALPVVPLSISSPEMFAVLIHYLYTLRTDTLLRALLPLSGHASIPSPDQLTREFSTYPPSTLQPYLHRIHGLWMNITALGIFDEKLWRTMEAAWEILHGALA
ncbi:hypothetical protein Clacol_010593 [Clathrus columnatus]|uniref:Uncharacterized protein n=1 Tax=Clathrus columnatus TaxID=1419009 RepID=A0AAV5AVF1_9AGAM|nr:hypothetical protein Clacol_009017 [Clathrus columnatus]GJJ16296.1 hypothetical protein Clacol_010593 [Clathrus columnatus]